GVRVVLGDGLGIPRGDLLVEDLGQGLRGEPQVLDALDVVGDGDRGDVGGDLDELVRAAAALLGGGQFLVGEVGVRAGPRYGPGDELLTASAGTDRVVVDRGIRVGLE